jgi:3-oxoacyl-[acyl-carrier-protein] synthase II
MGGLQAFEDCCATLSERGPVRVNPFSIPMIIPNMGAAWVSMELGTRGPLGSQCTACAASQMAIGEGLDAIRLGRAEVMLCGGADAAITRAGIADFAALRALSLCRREKYCHKGGMALAHHGPASRGGVPARGVQDGDDGTFRRSP